MSTTWLIGLIVADLIFAVVGNLIWKKSNRLDPASEKDKFKFFLQNQLGLIISIIAFLPLVILIFTNKDLSGKGKGIEKHIGYLRPLPTQGRKGEGAGYETAGACKVMVSRASKMYP